MAGIKVDVWIWRLDVPPERMRRLEGWLDADERQRAARFLAAADGASYIVGRGWLRELLGHHIAVAPTDVRFAYGPSGKPELTSGNGAIRFNLSHSGGWAALAISDDPSCRRIGIDIEAVRPVKEDLAARFFSAAEVAAIAELPPDLRCAAFFRGWTRKEAFVKAVGDGLNHPLSSFDVSVADERLPKILRIADADATELACWHLVDFSPAQGMAGAIALQADTANAVPSVHYHPLDNSG